MVMVESTPARLKRLEQARALVVALESGDDERVNDLIQDIGQVQESVLFQEICKLTRQLHDALTSFYLDERLTRLTQNDIPDARERLNYVITMTEQAANTTLNAVEELLPMVRSQSDRIAALKEDWRRFRVREMSVDEFRELSHTIALHFDESENQLEQIHERLTQVLMAQDFQDLTGQIIRRVINLVKDLEGSMVDMIRLSGGSGALPLPDTTEQAQLQIQPQPVPLHGPAVPGLDNDAVNNQDDVDSLLSSLGF